LTFDNSNALPFFAQDTAKNQISIHKNFSSSREPLKDRIVGGVVFQLLNGETTLLDINPYVGLKFGSRMTAGIGWNQRIGYRKKSIYLTSYFINFGPRTFAEYSLWNGFSARAEIEVLNTMKKTMHQQYIDVHEYTWTACFMIGLKKQFSSRGSVLMMINLYDGKDTAPYPNVLNTRLGFNLLLNSKDKIRKGSGAKI
jgi:hypothetical protein